MKRRATIDELSKEFDARAFNAVKDARKTISPKFLGRAVSGVTCKVLSTKLYNRYARLQLIRGNKIKAFAELYGNRGVTVCDEWRTFKAFRAWALANGFKKGKILCRRNTEGNFDPSNCFWGDWTDKRTEHRGRKSVILLSHNGETLTVTQWAKRIGIDVSSLRERLKSWSVEEALSTPKSPVRKPIPGLRETADLLRQLNKLIRTLENTR